MKELRELIVGSLGIVGLLGALAVVTLGPTAALIYFAVWVFKTW